MYPAVITRLDFVFLMMDVVWTSLLKDWSRDGALEDAASAVILPDFWLANEIIRECSARAKEILVWIAFLFLIKESL